MHIPDGYLSPSSCAGLYAVSTPFWYLGFRRLRNALGSRAIPLVAVFSAFSFVVMMFNLPLPGGTTGHAVGMGVVSIVLGPSLAVLAISTALLIQALLFGDGGVTALGANSFNMAIVGSLVAYAVYRVAAWRAPLTAARRIFAAALAGYCAINVAALCAAVEFGVQPGLFHDASGVPLYAPYPLRITIPAMMLGHLTFAGLAELFLSAGAVAFLQRSEPDLLRTTAPDAPDGHEPFPAAPSDSAGFHWPSPRKLWFTLGTFLVLTPLGIIAAGTAWGEWRPADFNNPGTRQSIAAASGGQAPTHAPAGLQRMYSLWSAPIPNYAPSFIRSPQFGYFASAAIGAGTVTLLISLLVWLVTRVRPAGRLRPTFLEKTVTYLVRLSEDAINAEEMARLPGVLQRIDPRVKLAGVAALVMATIAVHRLWLAAALFLLSGLLALGSRVSLRALRRRVWLPVLWFTGLIAAPALFLTPGTPAAHLSLLHWDITRQGASNAAFLLLRGEAAATFLFALVVSTQWNHLLLALRFFRVPATAVAILQMTCRYIFLFLHVAQDLFESRRTRLLRPLSPEEGQRVTFAVTGALLNKGLTLSADIHSAMEARGFRGNIRVLDHLALRGADWWQLALAVTIAALVIWGGR